MVTGNGVIKMSALGLLDLEKDKRGKNWVFCWSIEEIEKG